MGLSPVVTMDIALSALAGYRLLSSHAFLSARVIGELKLSYLAAGPTELRVLLIALTIAMYVQGKASDVLGDYSGYDLLIGGVGTLLIALFVIQTIATGRHLAHVDRRCARALRLWRRSTYSSLPRGRWHFHDRESVV